MSILTRHADRVKAARPFAEGLDLDPLPRVAPARPRRSTADESYEAGRSVALDGHDARPPADLTGDARSAWIDGYLDGREVLDAREIDWKAQQAEEEAEYRAAGFAPMCSEGR